MAQGPADVRRQEVDSDDRSMLPGGRSIFRAEALDRYSQDQDRMVFPRLVSSRGFRLLWLLAALFLVAGSLIAFWPILGPYVTGTP